MNKGFAILEIMLIIWAASLIGYGIHVGAIEIRDAPPPCGQVVDCDGFPVDGRR